MATFSPCGRIDRGCVEAEIVRLGRLWSPDAEDGDGLDAVLTPATLAAPDPFDRVQLARVVARCRESRSLSDAGRTLFWAPRARRTSANDADRLRKYLLRFGLDAASIADG